MKLQDFDKSLKDLFLKMQTYQNEFISKIYIVGNLNDNIDEIKNFKINIDLIEFLDSNSIFEIATLQVNFDLPANLENLFKSMINAIIAKINSYYAARGASILKDFGLEHVLKEYKEFYCFKKNKLNLFNKSKFLETFKNKNNSYFSRGLLYATNYGIGYFCVYMNKNLFENINKQISDYLNNLKIGFKNEFSEAFWVYRFKIAGNDKISNIEILKNLNIN